MSAYPPPPPGFDRQMMKQQIRMAKQQARLQRHQMRMQMRMYRRHSIVGPLVLVALGIVFLLAQTGRLSWSHALKWYGSWWPLVLIAAGVILLGEWALDQQAGPDGTVRVRRTLGAGVVVLLVFLALVGVSMRTTTSVYDHGVHLEDHLFGSGFGGFDQLGDRHDADDTAEAALPAGGMLTIRNPHGDVTVTGSSSDGQVHVSVHKQAWAWHESDAEDKERRLQPEFSSSGSNLTLSVAEVNGGQADLTVEVPKDSAITLQADHGDISVSELHATVVLSANHGDVDLSGITGAVTAHINDDNASVSGHSITGTLHVEGRMGEVNVSDITGGTTLDGDFFGTTHLERINGPVRFQSSRTQLEVARLDGDLDLDGDTLDADQLLGPVVLTTRYGKNITLERVQGSMQITNVGKGSVSVTSTSPVAPIMIANQHGSVDVGVPGGAGFVVNASTGNGEIENDFDLPAQSAHNKQWLQGKVAGGGSAMSINTVDGDVTIRKSEVEPLPPQPLAPPHISTVPPAPKAPAAAKAPRVPVAPKPPPAAPPV